MTGNGVIREMEFTEPLQVSILSEVHDQSARPCPLQPAHFYPNSAASTGPTALRAVSLPRLVSTSGSRLPPRRQSTRSPRPKAAVSSTLAAKLLLRWAVVIALCCTHLEEVAGASLVKATSRQNRKSARSNGRGGDRWLSGRRSRGNGEYCGWRFDACEQ